jgi:serine/threonine-protein kinase RsbW
MNESVLVEVPAAPAYVATIRSVTRAACALADLAADDVEELQIAVDEAATLLLPLVDPDGSARLGASFAIGTAELEVTLSVQSAVGAQVDQSGMAWIMLTGLDPSVEVRSGERETAITIGRRRSDALQ